MTLKHLCHLVLSIQPVENLRFSIKLNFKTCEDRFRLYCYCCCYMMSCLISLIIITALPSTTRTKEGMCPCNCTFMKSFRHQPSTSIKYLSFSFQSTYSVQILVCTCRLNKAIYEWQTFFNALTIVQLKENWYELQPNPDFDLSFDCTKYYCRKLHSK